VTATSVAGATVVQLRPSALVLQKADVPANLVLTFRRRITNAQLESQFRLTRGQIASWQRLTGYRTEFNTTREETRSNVGPTAIRLGAISRTAAGAHAYYLGSWIPNAQETWKTLRPTIGDESLIGSLDFTADGLRMIEYTIGWRDGRVTANVDVSGIPRGIRAEQAIALAQAQERKIAQTMH
jgi:hypothetical protein